MPVLGKVVSDVCPEFGNSKNEFGFAAKIKSNSIFLTCRMRRKFLEIQSRGTFIAILTNAMEFAFCHYHNYFLLNMRCRQMSHANFCRMRCLTCRIQQKLSIKQIICINSNAQSVFDIVRPFNILGVECDVKRFHIAFDA